MAGYYGKIGVSGIIKTKSDKTVVKNSEKFSNFSKSLLLAKKNKKPVLLRFSAPWCKNCEMMKATTFKDKNVKKLLKKYNVVDIDCEDPENPKIKKIIDHFNVAGLPSYFIIKLHHEEPANLNGDKQ